jgi:hypothetical protein
MLQRAKAEKQKGAGMREPASTRGPLVHTCIAIVASQMYKICVAKQGFSEKQEKMSSD